MTVSDRAFIRVFDESFKSPELAPHVVFAARGMHESTSTVGASASAEHRGSHLARAGNAGTTEQPAARETRQDRAAAVEKQPRASQPHVRTGQSTYLPSAFRGLVGRDEPHAAAGAKATTIREQVDKQATEPAPQRRPILEVVGHRPEVEEFRPALEVDALRWPAVVERMLQRRPEGLQVLCDALLHAMGRGESVIAFKSTSQGVGCTTMALASARLLAEARHSVAVVDADFAKPGVASAVGLFMDEGWETTLLSGAPLAESVIQSLADGVAIVPLAQLHERQVAQTSASDAFATSLQALAGHFDIVLVDAGQSTELNKSSDAHRGSPSGPPDACVLVHAYDDPHSTERAVPRVESLCPLIGVVENLAKGDAA